MKFTEDTITGILKKYEGTTRKILYKTKGIEQETVYQIRDEKLLVNGIETRDLSHMRHFLRVYRLA